MENGQVVKLGGVKSFPLSFYVPLCNIGCLAGEHRSLELPQYCFEFDAAIFERSKQKNLSDELQKTLEATVEDDATTSATPDNFEKRPVSHLELIGRALERLAAVVLLVSITQSTKITTTRPGIFALNIFRQHVNGLLSGYVQPTEHFHGESDASFIEWLWTTSRVASRLKDLGIVDEEVDAIRRCTNQTAPLTTAKGVLAVTWLKNWSLLMTLEFALTIETSKANCPGLDASSFDSTPAYMKSFVRKMAGLLIDSKVKRSKEGEDAASPKLWALAMAIGAVESQMTELETLTKGELRCMWEAGPSLFNRSLVLDCQLRGTMSAVKAATDAANILLADRTTAVTSTRSYLAEIRPIEGTISEQVFSEIQSAREVLAALEAQLPFSTTCPEVEMDEKSSFQGDLWSLERVTAELLKNNSLSMFEGQVDQFNDNWEKATKKKQKFSWKPGFGQGVLAYTGELRGELSKLCPCYPSELACSLDAQAKMENALVPANQANRRPKAPKGCVDYEPKRVILREMLIAKITDVFRSFGAVPIDTPVFETKEVLQGKYGEDQKLIYDVKDQGGEQLSLRYDLTVPFARYCATNNVERIKRYHIAKVYRRDEPQLARGRYREFYQCDIDIAGTYDLMVPDAEILTLLCKVLSEMQPIIGNHRVKLNHRGLLDGVMSLCGVPAEKIRPISSAIDKLDKEPWEIVRLEMIQLKGLDAKVADKLGEFVCIKGTYNEVKSKLTSCGAVANPKIAETISQLDKLFTILEINQDVMDHLFFDMSLARGLDYYTGIIFEAEVIGNELAVGSIAAGGRYDNLIGMFAGRPIPAAGFSVGIERVFRFAEMRLGIAAAGTPTTVGHKKGDAASAAASGASASADAALQCNTVDVYVCSIGDSMLKERIQIAGMLRNAGISTEYALSDKTKLVKQMATITEQGIPFAVIFGESEIMNRTVKVREFAHGSQDQTRKKETEVSLDNMVSFLNEAIALRGGPAIKSIEKLLLNNGSC